MSIATLISYTPLESSWRLFGGKGGEVSQLGLGARRLHFCGLAYGWLSMTILVLLRPRYPPAAQNTI